MLPSSLFHYCVVHIYYFILYLTEYISKNSFMCELRFIPGGYGSLALLLQQHGLKVTDSGLNSHLSRPQVKC